MLDLRVICTALEDFSEISPIEPSAKGGAKIAERILRVAYHHDFNQGCVVYG